MCEVVEAEEDTGEGGQKDCRLGWEVELDLDWDEGEHKCVVLLLTALPLLLALTVVLLSP